VGRAANDNSAQIIALNKQIAEARAAELESRVAVLTRTDNKVELPATDVEKMKLYHDAILDGQHDVAAQIMHEIRQQDADFAAARIRAEVKADLAQQQRYQSLEQTVIEMEQTYPFLDVKNEAFNDEVTQEVLEMHEYLIVKKGYVPADAMRKAATTVAQLHGLNAPAAPEAVVAPAAPAAVGDLVAEQRRQAAAAAAVKLQQQPSATPARAPMNPAQVVSIADMSDEEFMALPESKLRQLRGDFAV
jgi:hypothetical protein